MCAIHRERGYESGWGSCGSPFAAQGLRVVVLSQPCSGERKCEILKTHGMSLPSPEGTVTSGTSPENSDGATFPQTPTGCTHNKSVRDSLTRFTLNTS